MKKKEYLIAAVAGVMLMSFSSRILHTDTFNVDTTQSKLEWYAEKLTGKHNGTINFSGGAIVNNHGNLSGSLEVDMNSVKDLDLQDETYRTKLENHIKSPDFFDAAKYPKSAFVISSITPLTPAKAGDPTHRVKGNLTIKDKTNEIGFDAVVTMAPDKMTCVGSVVIDRSKFDVKYGSKTFFADIGDKVIYDDFTLKFNIVAVK